MSWQEFGDLESQVLRLPKGCNSAHVTDILQVMSSFLGYLRDPGSQPANAGGRGGDQTVRNTLMVKQVQWLGKNRFDDRIHGSKVETNRLWAWALQ